MMFKYFILKVHGIPYITTILHESAVIHGSSLDQLFSEKL